MTSYCIVMRCLSRALTSPEYKDVLRISAQRLSSIRDAYRVQDLHSLTTDTLPYAARIHRNTRSSKVAVVNVTFVLDFFFQ